MKIYTRTGDDGETGLFGGPRVRKDDPRLEAYGTVDELNSALGWARSLAPPGEIDHLLQQIQGELFELGAELATVDPAAHGTLTLNADHVQAIEEAIDRFEANLPPLRNFILPGGMPAAAALHVARTVCRRAERRLAALATTAALSPVPLVYLNRLGDLLFVLARASNAAAGQIETPWKKSAP